MKNTTRNSEKIKIGILWVGFSHCGCFAPFVKVSAYNNDIPTPICYRNHIGTNRTEWFVHKTLVSPIPCSRLQSSSHSTFFDRKFLQKDTKKTKRTLRRFHVQKLLRTYPKRVFDPKKAFNPQRKTAHDFAVSVLTVVFSRGIHHILSRCIKTISGSIKTLGCLFYIGDVRLPIFMVIMLRYDKLLYGSLLTDQVVQWNVTRILNTAKVVVSKISFHP